ncbi:MAG: heavy metal translocating P-type ATPase [Thermoanaerobaculia bacterium]
MKDPRERSHLRAAPVACAHCGLAVPEGMLRPGEEKQFCCNGCRQVHDLIRDWGYEKFYGLVEQQGGVLEPARPTGRAFEDLDDPRALEGANEEEPGGRCRTRLYLEGVHCAACVWLVEKLPEALDGVDSVRLNLASAVAEVTWRPGTVKLSAIARALDRLGYSPHVHRAGRARDARRAEDRAALVKLGVAAAGAMNLMFLHGALYAGEASGMASPYETFFRWVSLGIALPVLAFSARPFFQTAYAGLKSRFVHIDLPVAIGIAVTFAASAANVVRGSGPVYFDSLAMLVAALLGARQAQRAAQRAALERADSLRGVAFLEFARRLEGDGPLAPAVEVPVAALEPGDRVEVRSGELVPADGVVFFGRSTLDASVLTGESAPVPVAEGGAVWAGVTNLGARLVVRVEAAGEKTRVGALLAVVQDALARRPAVLRLTDLLARRFVQALLLLAAAALLLALPLGTEAAVERVVALLVVACPCALGLSVPLAVSVGLMRAARGGIFVKDPDALDRLRHVGTVLLDKTGTLTEGKATFTRYEGDDAALDLAAALEAESSHAVAHALRAVHARRVNVVREVAEVSELAGRGISGLVDGRRVAVGNRAHVAAFAPSVPEGLGAHAEALVADGLSPLWVAVDGRVAGVGGIGDALRADARATVDALRARGVRVRILSGDDPRVVASVAARLGIAPEDALGGRTPEEKRDLVASLVASRAADGRGAPAVVMVGDGVNDAAALALADVGVAVLGGKGASLVAADVVLTREGVAPLLDLLRGSRRVFGVIRRNLAFSLVYNVAGAALALLGLVGPLLAAVLMPVSSLTVVLSSALSRPFPGPARRPARAPSREA